MGVPSSVVRHRVLPYWTIVQASFIHSDHTLIILPSSPMCVRCSRFLYQNFVYIFCSSSCYTFCPSKYYSVFYSPFHCVSKFTNAIAFCLFLLRLCRILLLHLVIKHRKYALCCYNATRFHTLAKNWRMANVVAHSRQLKLWTYIPASGQFCVLQLQILMQNQS